MGDKGTYRRALHAESRAPVRTVDPGMGEEEEQPGSKNAKLLKRAKNTAYRYLTIRNRSRRELEGKLNEKEFPADIISSVLDHLSSLGYLDDRAFATQWAASRVRSRGFGGRRIEQELRNKGISSDTIKETLRTLFEEAPEADVARKEADKKLRTLDRFEPEVRRRRLAGFLERKGFSSGIIRSILRTVR